MSLSRVIEVSFGGGSIAYVKADTAYFYNNGIIFKPTDIDLPASYQVHWADSPQATTTLETIGTAEGAPIPDDLWNRSRVIYGWIYLHPTEDSGITAYEIRIYKNVRAGLPDGTEPTPAEQSTIDQLISALNSAVEQAEDAQEAIENMSVSATTLAEGASATVTKSEQDGVVHLAFGIPKGQTGDTPTITASKTGKTTSIYVDGSEVAQIEDGTDGTNGNDGYSPTASVTKSGKVATITITDKNGTTSAQVEDGEDGIDGISPSVSVTDITGGHRVVITDKDGAKSFDVEDGATGATPNLTIGTVETLEPTESATATITGTPENPVLNFGIPKGDTGEVTLEDYYKAFPTDTASGAIASFTDGADDLPLKSLIVDINPVQDLSHGDPSPENICPISGWTQVGVNQSGVNLFDANSFVSGRYDNADFSISSASDTRSAKIYLKAGSYTLSANGTSAINCRILNGAMSSAIRNLPMSFALSADGWFGFSTTDLTSDFKLELGSTATAYEPYTGRSITIQLGQTVYGGKLDVLSGELVIDMAMVDLGTLNWGEYGSTDTATQYYTTNLDALAKLFGRAISDVGYYSQPIVANTIYITRPSGMAYVRTEKDKYASPAAFKTAMSGHYLVYELATPITVQLSANQINSLYGVNNIWADSGNTEVEYRADTKLFIERLTAPDSADMIADANITSGKYFMVGNSLYKATANIANGSAIVVGTNCIRKSLSEALNEINA